MVSNRPVPFPPSAARPSREDFGALVRDALAKLYDLGALRAHALTDLVTVEADRPALARGEPMLQRRLLAAIEALRPSANVDANARPWRTYRALQMRYVEGLNAAEVQRRLAVSRSQYYREHDAALATLSELLWQQRADRLARDGAGTSGTAGDARAVAAVEARVVPAGEPRTRSGAWRWPALAAGLAVLAAVALLALRAQRAEAPHVATTAATVAAQPTAAARPIAPTLRIYAGSGQPGYENGAAATSKFSGPFGLSVDASGSVFVADTGNNRIRRIVSSGLVVDVAGSGVAGYLDGPVATAQFSAPNAVTVTPDGTVYVGDAGNLRVRAISPSGMVTTLAGSGTAGYVDATGTEAKFGATGAVVSDRAGNVYVTDRPANVLRKITPSGVVTTFSGSGARGHVDGPSKIAQFNGPQRMGGVDGDNNVYVLDTVDWRIRRVGPDGAVATVAGGGPAGYADGPVATALFSTDIQGMCVDAGGNLFVMDAGNRRVRKVTRDGVVSTLYEFTDANQTPGAIKIDLAGNLYLADRDHNVIYKLTVVGGR